MIKRNSLYVICFLILPILISAQSKLYDINKNMEVFIEVYKTLNEDFVDDIDPAYLMKIGIDAMAKSLDPYTRYISESDVESYRISVEGKYEGIGAITKKIDDHISIVDTYSGSPALKSGLKIGDKILKINGQNTKGKSREDAKKIMRGVKGSRIEFEVENVTGDIKTITLTRQNIDIPNVPYSGMVSDKVGYIILTTFTANASKNVKMALRKLKKENPEMEGLILDLRGNGGGIIERSYRYSQYFCTSKYRCCCN